jgi:hypothetical protein
MANAPTATRRPSTIACRINPFGSDTRKAFFFEKKKQKTFILQDHAYLRDTLKN